MMTYLKVASNHNQVDIVPAFERSCLFNRAVDIMQTTMSLKIISTNKGSSSTRATNTSFKRHSERRESLHCHYRTVLRYWYNTR